MEMCVTNVMNWIMHDSTSFPLVVQFSYNEFSCLKGKTVPEHVQTVIDEEMDRLSYLEGESSEFK